MKTGNSYKWLLLAVVIGICMFSCKKKSGYDMGGAPSIEVTRPIVKPVVLYKEYPGYLSSEQEVPLVARVNGYIEQITYTPGAKVKKGDLLFVIEPSLYKDQVMQAEAALQNAQAALEYNQSNYARMKEAAASNAISQIDLLQAETNLKQAKAALSTASAQLETAKTNLSYCYVQAPFDGRVSKNQYDLHAYVNGSLQATTLATIYKDQLMYAYFNIEDNQFLKIQYASAKSDVPKIVTLSFQEAMRQPYEGRLTYISPNVELSTGTLNLRAEVKNPNGELKSGLFVTINLPYGEKDSAVLVQDAAIGTDQLGLFLYAVNDSNRVEYRHIQVGQLVSDTLREVLSGISPQERYVTKALLKVRNGMTINPKEQ